MQATVLVSILSFQQDFIPKPEWKVMKKKSQTIVLTTNAMTLKKVGGLCQKKHPPNSPSYYSRQTEAERLGGSPALPPAALPHRAVPVA